MLHFRIVLHVTLCQCVLLGSETTARRLAINAPQSTLLYEVALQSVLTAQD